MLNGVSKNSKCRQAGHYRVTRHHPDAATRSHKTQPHASVWRGLASGTSPCADDTASATRASRLRYRAVRRVPYRAALAGAPRGKPSTMVRFGSAGATRLSVHNVLPRMQTMCLPELRHHPKNSAARHRLWELRRTVSDEQRPRLCLGL